MSLLMLGSGERTGETLASSATNSFNLAQTIAKTVTVHLGVQNLLALVQTARDDQPVSSLLTLTSLPAVKTILQRSVTSTLTVTELLAQNRNAVASISETLIPAQSVSVSQIALDSVAEALTLANSLTLATALVRSVSESLPLVGTASGRHVALGSVAQPLSLASSPVLATALVRSVSESLTLAETQTNTHPLVLPGLIHLWKLADGTDSLGSITLAATTTQPDYTTAGKIGNCAKFNSTANQALFNGSALPGITSSMEYWVSLWFNVTNYNTAGQTLFMLGNAASTQQVAKISYGNTGTLTYKHVDNTPTTLTLTTTFTPSSSAWHHLFFWYDNVAQKINISVDNATAQTLTATSVNHSAQNYIILAGNGTNGTTITGSVDALHVGQNPSGGIASVVAAIRAATWNSGNGFEGTAA